MRKDIKKSSYYVWFLGAQEARGLRGAEYVAPVVRALVDREREVEPFKVTLQVSHKGMKIVQNVPGSGVPARAAKPEVVKHFVPHHAITFVHQQEDLVACILLLYNPSTRCPVHVHAYRCDSVETATLLHGQLRVLTERPDNQKKLVELECRLTAKGLLPSGPTSRRRVPPPGSTSTRESESSGGSSCERHSSPAVGHQERIANLYDSLAAELKEKLGTGGQQAQAPILLPPRDYDTVHRQKGNLSEINARRCLNMNIVGVHASGSPEGARVPSGGSSGIGSDHAPSPDHEPDHDNDQSFLDNQSTSDEEWNTKCPDGSMFVVQQPQSQSQGPGSWRGSGGGGGGGELSLPRARRLRGDSNNFVEPDIHYYQNRSKNHDSDHKQIEEPAIHPDLVKIKKHHSINSSSSQPGSHQPVSQRRRRNAEQRQRSPSPTNAKSTVGSLTPRDRFNDAKEKFLSLEREKQEERERQDRALMSERRRNLQALEPPISPAVMPVVRSRSNKSWSRSRDSEDDMEELMQNRYPANDEGYRYHNEREFISALRREPSYLKSQSHGSLPDSEDHTPRHVGKPSLPYAHREEQRRRVNPSPSRSNLDNHAYNIEDKCNPPIHRRYASPSREQSPEMKVIKENQRSIPRKYPEECSVDEMNSRYSGKIPRSHLNMNPVPFAENNNAIPLERYRSPTRASPSLRPSPRHQRYPSSNSDEDANPNYRHMMHPDTRNFPPRGQYDDKKRRSLYESIEDERRRNSNELAKEFKRRSFQDHGANMELSCANPMGYQELDERERYPGLDRETARVHPGDQVNSSPPRYRHSYAEPFNHQPHNAHHDMLHCNNTALSSGRVGIAAIHPY